MAQTALRVVACAYRPLPSARSAPAPMGSLLMSEIRRNGTWHFGHMVSIPKTLRNKSDHLMYLDLRLGLSWSPPRRSSSPCICLPVAGSVHPVFCVARLPGLPGASWRRVRVVRAGGHRDGHPQDPSSSRLTRPLAVPPCRSTSVRVEDVCSLRLPRTAPSRDACVGSRQPWPNNCRTCCSWATLLRYR
jgi:hypothetical protein